MHVILLFIHNYLVVSESDSDFWAFVLGGRGVINLFIFKTCVLCNMFNSLCPQKIQKLAPLL